MGLVELILAQITATSLFYALAITVVSATAFALKASFSSSTVNPFEKDCRKRRQPPNTDKTSTDKVLKQGESRGWHCLLAGVCLRKEGLE